MCIAAAKVAARLSTHDEGRSYDHQAGGCRSRDWCHGERGGARADKSGLCRQDKELLDDIKGHPCGRRLGLPLAGPKLSVVPQPQGQASEVGTALVVGGDQPFHVLTTLFAREGPIVASVFRHPLQSGVPKLSNATHRCPELLLGHHLERTAAVPTHLGSVTPGCAGVVTAGTVAPTVEVGPHGVDSPVWRLQSAPWSDPKNWDGPRTRGDAGWRSPDAARGPLGGENARSPWPAGVTGPHYLSRHAEL
jgi:hypothetical protein